MNTLGGNVVSVINEASLFFSRFDRINPQYVVCDGEIQNLNPVSFSKLLSSLEDRLLNAIDLLSRLNEVDDLERMAIILELNKIPTFFDSYSEFRRRYYRVPQSN